MEWRMDGVQGWARGGLWTPPKLFANCVFCLYSYASSSMSYKWNYTLYSLLRLSFFLLIDLRFIHVVACITSSLRQWHPTPVLLPGKSHGWRSLEGCSPWVHWGSDTTERLHFHFSLSCIGEGNGNPLQCSCLENPRDRGAWWAAVCGVTQSWTRLKWLSNSNSNSSPLSGYCLSIPNWTFELFPVLVVINQTTINISVWSFVWTYVFTSLEKIMHRRSTAGSYVKYILL